MKELMDLFFIFARIGGLTFGGGYAMLPILQREIVDTRAWATSEELIDYYAIGQCTPGVIAVNTATFIGYNRRGIPGALFATFGMCFPSLVIIISIAALVSNFSDIALVAHAFAGIRVCVVVLIFNAIANLWKSSVTDKWALVIFLTVLGLSIFTSLPTMLFIVASGIAGLAIKNIGGIKK